MVKHVRHCVWQRKKKGNGIKIRGETIQKAFIFNPAKIRIEFQKLLLGLYFVYDDDEALLLCLCFSCRACRVRDKDEQKYGHSFI